MSGVLTGSATRVFFTPTEVVDIQRSRPAKKNVERTINPSRTLPFNVISELWTQSTATEMVRQVSLLNSNISNLVDAFHMLVHQLHEDKDSVESVHVVREISLDDAKSEVLDLFEKDDVLSFSEIAETLSLSLDTVVKVCETLESSGLIEATN